MNDSPRVSVVIPVYNREAYVGAAIDSVLAQSFADFEVLVIDDGSTDRSRDIVRAYRDPRVRLVCHERNQGLPRTRNTGIDTARGAYLAFLDSDDIAFPARLAKQVAFLDAHPDHAAVGAAIDWMDHAGKPTGRIKRRYVAARDVAALRLFRQGIENTASTARTAVLRAYRHNESFAVSEDYEIWARIGAEHWIANLPEVLVRRRIHGQQTSKNKDEETRRYRHAIYAAQLRTLGIDFAEQDLERHYLLRRMHKIGFTPDRAYVDWAAGWLLALQAANARVAIYPEPSFSQMLGAYWLKTCWTAAPALGWPTVWRRFRASPLRRRAWIGLRKEALLKAPRLVWWLAGLQSGQPPRDGLRG